MIPIQEKDRRSYDDILISFIKELNSLGADIKFETLDEQKKLQLMDILIGQCKEHIKPFVIHVLGYDWYWFHEIWFNDFKQFDINCNIAARGLGKSFFWTRMLPEYLAFIIGGYKTVISSYNEPATFDFVKDNRTDYEDNEFLGTKVAVSKSDDWNKSNLDFTNKSNVRGISITSQIRRLHVNFFNADDIINDEQKLSPEAIKSKIFATILPTLERKRGKFNIVGTRFTEDDIYAYFKEEALKNESWHYCELRLELDEKNEKIFVIHSDENGDIKTVEDTFLFDFKRLLTLKITEPNYFAREYECSIVSDEDVPYPLNILQECKDRELSYDLVGTDKIRYMGGLDSSNSTTKNADDTVLMIGYKDSDGMIVPANIFADNTMESPDRLSAIKKVMEKFSKPNVLAEKNSMGQTNIDMINRDGYRLEPFFTDRLKKLDLTDYASVMVKRRHVRLPYKTPKDQRITDILIHQLSGVRSTKTRGGLPTYRGTTKHDDYYIAFILMVKLLADKGRPTKIRGWTRKDLLDNTKITFKSLK